jgi:hypothetical protein
VGSRRDRRPGTARHRGLDFRLRVLVQLPDGVRDLGDGGRRSPQMILG